jgi:alpha-1,3-mannosyltransferase
MFRTREVSEYKTLLIMFTSNLIGMACSRGTHQQFYSWYSYTLPFLFDAAFGPNGQRPLTKFALFLLLEIAWSVAKPRNVLQSVAFNFVHLALLVGLLRQENLKTLKKGK